MCSSATRSDSETLHGGLGHPAPELVRRDRYWQGSFQAMASPCELLWAGDDEQQAVTLMQKVADEAWRIEQKFSRYRDDNIVHAINSANGRPVRVDDETANLLNFADTCFQISDGSFDVTSGVLRKAWHFDGSDHVPSKKKIRELLPLVGWQKVTWRKPIITLRAGMEIDLGGIGKEYAVDRCALLVAAETKAGALTNFGGDLRATGPRADGSPWQVGVEKVCDHDQQAVLSIHRGAIATSGDARRYVLRNGKRYGHILDPKTGWPVKDAARSITVIDETCTQAGLLATLAMLKGEGAEAFLESQQVKFHILR